MKSLCVLLCYGFAFFTASNTVGVVVASPRPGSWGSAISNHGTEKKKWSSFMTVNPARMISYMVKHGGLIIPKNVEKELKVFGKVCHVDELLLNVLEHKIQIRNFVLHVEGKPDEVALRIGRVYLHWDKYLRPCVDIEVDDVEIFVEFLNVLLTRNNWNLLKESGFPPTMETDEKEKIPKKGDKSKKKATQQETFLRIGGIDLSGNITCTFRSRPLNKEIAVLNFDLDTFDELDRQIRARSEENKAATGRRGCTTNELYSLVQSFFGAKLKRIASSNMEDVFQGREMSSIQDIKKALKSSSNSFSGYMDDAKGWSEDVLQGKVSESIEIGKKTLDKVGKNKLFQAVKAFQTIDNENNDDADGDADEKGGD